MPAAGTVPPPGVSGVYGRQAGGPYGTGGAPDPYGAYTPDSGYRAPTPVAPPVHPLQPAIPGSFGWAPIGPKRSGMGVAALVLGLCSLAMFCVLGLNVVMGLLAVVFGIIGRKRVARGEAENGRQATAGIVLGALGMLLGALVFAAAIWAGDDEGAREEKGAPAPAAVTAPVAAPVEGAPAAGVPGR
ncbi:DUF4190 domain-containing protein [Streptomyces sp. NPDC059248]|uniref:DUF4190 domain-containing protein n=1 Tax=Streptomyces sp. NPDC059248 TaxID=3346791 RepID=UPI003691B58D